MITSFLIGCKNKNLIDQIAVTTIQDALNKLNIKVKVVIGEGVLDKAPMLYQGEILGNHASKKIVDLIVDPIENTTGAAYDNEAAMSCFAMIKHNTIKMLIPEMYMEKIFVGPALKTVINLANGLAWNVTAMQHALHKTKLKCVILNRPRHEQAIKDLHTWGVETYLINNGDVIGAIDVALGEYDFLYGIGCTPEGYLKAALAISLHGKLQFKLTPINQIWLPTDEHFTQQASNEAEFFKHHPLTLTTCYEDIDLISDNNPVFFAFSLNKSKLIPPILKTKSWFYITRFVVKNNKIAIKKAKIK